MLNKTILVTGCTGSLENLKQLKDKQNILKLSKNGQIILAVNDRKVEFYREIL